MTTKLFRTLAVVALMTAGLSNHGVSAAAAQDASPRDGVRGGSKPMHDDRGKMTAAEMMREPHHILAMAFRSNLQTFASALRDQVSVENGFDRDFAGVAVVEMRRSLDEMQKHQREHTASMDADAKTTMAMPMRHLEEHQAAIEKHLVALESEVAKAAPDSRSILQHAREILESCQGMSKGMASAAASKTD